MKIFFAIDIVIRFSKMSIPNYFDIDRGDYAPNTSLEDYYWVEYKADGRDNLENDRTYAVRTKDTNAYMRLGQAFLEVKVRLTKENGAALVSDSEYDPLIAPINSAWHFFSSVRATLANQLIYNSKYAGKEHLIRHLIHYDKEYAKSIASQLVFYPETASDGGLFNWDEADPDNRIPPRVRQILPANGSAANSNLGASETGMHKKHLYRKRTVRNHDGTGQTQAVGEVKDNPFYNKGFMQRVKQFVKAGQDSKYVTLWLPISEVITFFQDYDKIFHGLDFVLELQKNESYAEVLFGDLLTHNEERTGDRTLSGAGVTTTSMKPKFMIKSLSLWVPQLKPSLRVLADIEEKYLNSSQMIMYRHVNGYPSQPYTTQGGSRAAWNVTTETAKPLRAYVAFQLQERSKSYELNAGQFDLLFSQVYLKVNGEFIPRDYLDIEFDPTTGTSKFSRALQDIYKVGGKGLVPDDSCIINFENWVTTYPILAFDLEQFGESLFKNSIAHIELEWIKRDPTYVEDAGGPDYSLEETGLTKEQNTVMANKPYIVWLILETERAIQLTYKDKRATVLWK